MRRVYQFGLRPPIDGEALVRAQMRAAHEYQNDLVAIERGRRCALRAIDYTDDVREAVELVKAATKSTRKVAVTALRIARKQARAAAADELARIHALDKEICKSAYNHASCAWGTRLDIAARHQQSRAQPLYGDDGITPNDPAFGHGPRWRDALPPDDVRAEWWLANQQIGVQLQGGLPTAAALRGHDTRVRLVLGDWRGAESSSVGRRGVRSGVLWMRVGSDGRDPVWAKWPIMLHRPIPDGASWKWVRVSVRRTGLREEWSAEITVDEAGDRTRSADAQGVIAVEWEWSPLDDGGLRVARWADEHGQTGEVVLPARMANGIRKPDGIRAVRDLVLDDMRPRLQRALQESKETLPAWLREAANTLHLWKSPDRFRQLAGRWRNGCDAARNAYEILDAWEGRERHLYDYEASVRDNALRSRRHTYRTIAARWARQYRVILLSDQDLSREARFGDDSDRRFTAGVSEFRGALRNAFGEADAIDSLWRDKPDEEDERLWCERTRDAWMAGGARGDGRFAARKEKTQNAWAARKAKAAAKRAANETAREPGANDAKRQAS